MTSMASGGLAAGRVRADGSIEASRLLGRIKPVEPETLDEARLFATIDRSAIYAEVAWVTAAVLAVVMVRRLTHRQRGAFHDIAETMRTAEEKSAARLAAASSLPGYSAPIEPVTGPPAGAADVRRPARTEADQPGPDPGRD